MTKLYIHAQTLIDGISDAPKQDQLITIEDDKIIQERGLVKDENGYGDFVCFQITSNESQTDIAKIETTDMASGELKLVSFVKYDKCFTINSAIVEKSIGVVSDEFLLKIKNLFCESI